MKEYQKTEKYWKKIGERYKAGESVYRISKSEKISGGTINKYLMKYTDVVIDSKRGPKVGMKRHKLTKYGYYPTESEVPTLEALMSSAGMGDEFLYDVFSSTSSDTSHNTRVDAIATPEESKKKRKIFKL